jgi:hypothetical protein
MALHRRWYRAGTIAVENGSTTVAGTLTAWLASVREGDSLFHLASMTVIEVAAVNDNNEIELGDPWPGTTISGAAYAIIPSSPGWGQTADLAKQFEALIDSQTDIFSGEGVPSNELGGDGSVYVRTDEPKLYKKAAGEWDSGITMVGPTGAVGPGFNATSTTSVDIGAGSKSLTIGTGFGYAAGMRVRATASSDPTKWIEGIVTAYSGGVLVFTADLTGGSGTINSWVINTAGERGAVGATGPSYAATSTTSLAIGTGSKAFTTQAGLAYVVGSRVRAASAADPSNFMEGVCSGYSSTTLTLNVDLVGGSGTLADWNLSLAGQRGVTGASYAATSTTSRNLGTGSMSFTVQANLAIVVGTRIRGASNANPSTKWLEGVVTAYAGASLTILSDLFMGSGAVTDWNFSVAGERGQQGFTGYASTSTTSRTVSTGSKAFTVGTGYGYQAGMRLRASSTADPTVFVEGVVTAYSGGDVTITADKVGGSGTVASWNINPAGQPGIDGAGAGTVTQIDAEGGIEVVAGGSITSTGALRLVDTAVDPGSYGGGLTVPVITVDQKGRLTGVTTASIPDPVAMAIVFGA